MKAISQRYFRQKLKAWAALGFTVADDPEKTERFRKLDNELPTLAYRFFIAVDPSLEAEMVRFLASKRKGSGR